MSQSDGSRFLVSVVNLLSHITNFTDRMLMSPPDRVSVPSTTKPAASPPSSDQYWCHYYPAAIADTGQY
jgi:hypothetical protein